MKKFRFCRPERRWILTALFCLLSGVNLLTAQTSEQSRRFSRLLAEGKSEEARSLLTEVSRNASGSAEFMYMSAAYYASQRNYRLALLFMNECMAKADSPGYEQWFLLGDIQQKSNLFEEALESFESALKISRKRTEPAARIRQCRLGKELRARPLEVRISNLGPVVNTAADEYRAGLTGDFVHLFFNRKLPAEGISSFQAVAAHGNNWEKPQSLVMQAEKTGEALLFSGVSPDGKLLLLESSGKKSDLFISHWENGRWSQASPFAWNSPKSSERSASVSSDGNYLFFVSDRSGNPDIWFCRKKGDAWMKPERAGAEVNTAAEEESPWLDADGQYLYFSSRGHDGLGGFDVFKVPFGRKGSRPENIGYPVNSASDDLHFMLMPDEKTAFYTSSREGGQGGSDVYSVKMNITGNTQLVLFKGTVSDSYGAALEAGVVITETGQSNPVARLKTNKETGTFVTLLPAGKTYSMLVEKEGYLFYSDLLNFQDGGREKDGERKIRLQKLLAGTSLILHNIFFDAGKSSLRKESSPELQRLLLILRQNPGIRAEISGHSEPGGPEDLLQKLTENRAQAVVDYLVATGIKSSRLVAKGYGSSKSASGKNSIEAAGTRTEFRVLSIQ